MKFLRAVLVLDLAVLLGGGIALAVHEDDEPAVVVESSIDLARSADQTLGQTTARLEMTMAMEGLTPGSDETFEFVTTGVMDFVNERSELTMDMSTMFEQLGDDVPPELASMRVIQDGAATYMCGGAFTAGFGAECVVIDLTEIDPAFADLFGGAIAAPTGNQAAFLESLRAAGDVEELGEEDVRGVRTKHVRATFTLEDALAQSPDPEALRSAFAGIGFPEEALTAPQEIEAWIDAEGFVRRYRQAMDFGTLTGGEVPGAATITMEMFDFGVPAVIEIPTDAIPLSEILPPESFTETGEEINTD